MRNQNENISTKRNGIQSSACRQKARIKQRQQADLLLKKKNSLIF
ncbi:Hypothetical protein Minf_0763 [Methylacidiphilum infernorum V4]|uniref:Uncharacterized protein n=1 Tax=Methylacidiphilum infernorum (isolate V4) TaxID=481448 RepID=B3E0R4_METI4|nr:Hypothetical protein Minf_0763 [Methylacidiphilum infernorum V4]